MSFNYVKCSELIDVRDGTHDSPKYVLNGYPLVTSKNIKDNKIDFENVNFICEEDFNKINLRSEVEDGDILMPMIGTVGNPVLVNTEEKFAIKNVALFKLAKNQDVNSKYFYYLLTSNIIKRQLDISKRGGTQNFVSLSNLRELDIPLVSIDIQIRFVEILDKAQELIDKRKAQIEALDELIKSVFYDMFESYIDNKKCYKAIKNIIDFIDYRGKTPKKTDNGIKLITAKNVGYGYYKEDPKEYISEELYRSSMTRGYPKSNDVLFATEGATLGYVARIPRNYKEFAVGQRLITMVCKENLTPEYLEKYMTTQYFQKDVEQKATGSSAKGIRSVELKEIEIPIPPIDLQNKFAQIVETIEKQKELLQQSRTELENNFNSLMHKAFKGELFN